MNAWCYDENAIALLKSLIPRKGELVRPPLPEMGRGGLHHPSLGDLVRPPHSGVGGGSPMDVTRCMSRSPLMIRCKYDRSTTGVILPMAPLLVTL